MLTRRHFLATAAAAPALSQTRPPNLLVIVIDQLSGLGLPPFQRHVPLPACARLALSGIHFTHAYTAGMTCGPSRASLDNGLAVPAHRVGEVRPPPAVAQSLTRSLADAGYVTSHPQGYNLDSERAQHVRWLAELGYAEPLSSLYGSEPLAQYLDLPLKWKCGRIGLAPEHAFDAYCAQRAIQFLETNRERPFACFLQLRGPHDPYMAPRGYDTLVNPDDVALPKYRQGELEQKPPRQRASAKTQGADRMSDDQLRRILALYHGMTAFSDHCAGQVLDRLDQLGLTANTVVALVSDHGDTLGHHRFMSKDFAFYEPAVRIPFLLRAPGMPAGRVSADPVSGIDLYPTLAQLLRLPTPQAIQGESLVSRWQGTHSAPDRPIFSAQGVPGVNRALMVRTKAHKYTTYDDGGQELYDLARDPGELDNLAGLPAHAEVEARLAGQLQDWLKSVSRR